MNSPTLETILQEIHALRGELNDALAVIGIRLPRKYPKQRLGRAQTPTPAPIVISENFKERVVHWVLENAIGNPKRFPSAAYREALNPSGSKLVARDIGRVLRELGYQHKTIYCNGKSVDGWMALDRYQWTRTTVQPADSSPSSSMN